MTPAAADEKWKSGLRNGSPTNRSSRRNSPKRNEDEDISAQLHRKGGGWREKLQPPHQSARNRNNAGATARSEGPPSTQQSLDPSAFLYDLLLRSHSRLVMTSATPRSNDGERASLFFGRSSALMLSEALRIPSPYVSPSTPRSPQPGSKTVVDKARTKTDKARVTLKAVLRDSTSVVDILGGLLVESEVNPFVLLEYSAIFDTLCLFRLQGNDRSIWFLNRKLFL